MLNMLFATQRHITYLPRKPELLPSKGKGCLSVNADYKSRCTSRITKSFQDRESCDV